MSTSNEPAGLDRIRADYDEYVRYGGRHSFATWYEHYADCYPDVRTPQ